MVNLQALTYIFFEKKNSVVALSLLQNFFEAAFIIKYLRTTSSVFYHLKDTAHIEYFFLIPFEKSLYQV